MKEFNKIWLLGLVPIIIGIIWFAQPNQPIGVSLVNPQVVEWVKPVNDRQWAEDNKKESLDLKFDFQLTQMKENLEDKLPLHEEDLEEITLCPDCIKWELRQNFKEMFEKEGNPNKIEGKTLQEWIDGEFIEQLSQKTWEVEKVIQSIERIDNERRLRDKGFLTIIDRIPAGNPERDNIKANERSPLGTTFYIDADCATPGNGSEPTCDGDANDPFNDILDFTETSRSAGDIAFLRRGTTALYDDGSDLLFTSDGLISNPIIISADYDNIDWGGGGTFATSSQTYTPVFGAKTMEASATITGISANDWIYVEVDCFENPSTASINTCGFAYEVDSVSGTTLTLFLPYKGNQSGSGNDLRVMPNAPIWGTAATSIQWNFDGDDYWSIKGIHIRGTDPNGNVELDNAGGQIFQDVIFEGNGSGDDGLNVLDDRGSGLTLKSRFFNHIVGTSGINGVASLGFFFKDNLFDGNNVSSSFGYQAAQADNVFFEETEFKNHGSGDINAGGAAQNGSLFKGRNLLLTSSTPIDANQFADFRNFFMEDYQGVVGDNFQFLYFATSENDSTIRSTTTPVRSGGGATSIEVLPSTKLSSNWELSQVLLFEYPIHTDTTSRDYQVFFRSGDGTPFIASPTADELWIECEYWGHATNNFRRLTKSTGTVDFTTDSDYDQSLTVTCNPSQTGILYLRGWYAKTKEADTNIFFVDPRPVITDT